LVVLLGTTDDEPLTGRLASELRAMGMAVEVRAPQIDDASVDVEIDKALRDGAGAAVHIQSHASGIEIVIADPKTRSRALREVLEVGLTGNIDVDAVLPLRASEFVRAMLLGPIDSGSHPTQALDVPPSITPLQAGGTRLPGTRSGFGLTLSSGFAIASGGLGAQVELGLHVRIYLGRLLGLELVGIAPLTTEAVPGAAAMNARASVWLAGAALFARRAVGRSGGVEIGGGAMALALRVAGDAGAGWDGGAETRIGAAAYGRLGSRLTLSRGLSLRADLILGDALRRPVASAGGPGEYPWGYSFGVVLAGVEARWF
jgi:hypothetical protein